MVYVNTQMILAYYEIGKIINEWKTWGSKYIERLSNDLKEYGSGYSFRNLKYMSQFTKEFNGEEIRQQPVAQIPWGTIIVIMQKSKTHEKLGCSLQPKYLGGPWFKLYLNQNLYRMSKFAVNFNEKELFSQPVREISWGTIIIIMQ